MNWSDLHFLHVFHHSGSLKEAAARLYVNHTTVARRIRELEDALGCKLVEHIAGRLVLTVEGQVALGAAERMTVCADDLRRELSGRDEALRGTLKVTLLDLQLYAHMPIFERFRQRYPAVELELLATTSRTHSLVKREADVALRVTRQPRSTLVGRRLLRLDYAVFAHHALLDLPRTRWPWIGWTAHVGATLTEQWMQDHLTAQQSIMRVDSTWSMIQLAKRAVGAAILPVHYASREEELVQVDGVLDGFHTYLWLLSHRDLMQSARVRAFADIVYEEIAAFQDGGQEEE